MRALLLIVAIAAGCTPSGPYIRLSPLNSYRAYGEYHPQAQDDAIVAKAASADINGHEIRLFQEALPPGIEMKDGTLGVAAGHAHRLLGKYAYSSGKEVSKDELVATVKKMCVTTGANAAIIIFQLVPNDHQDRAQGIEAVLIALQDQPPTANGGGAAP